MHPPHQPKPNEPGRKITPNFGEDLFFFFFFLETTWFWAKKSLNFCYRSKNHSQFRWRHPNFWGFVLKIPPHQNFLDPPLTASKCSQCYTGEYQAFVDEVNDALFRVSPSEFTDFIAHVGTDTDAWKGVIGKHGVTGKNENGMYLL